MSSEAAGVKLLDAAETVDFLGGKFSKWTIYELAKKRKIPFVKIAGRIYFRPESLIDWLTRLEQETASMVEPESLGKIRRLK